jgi:hypothetical protein
MRLARPGLSQPVTSDVAALSWCMTAGFENVGPAGAMP